MAFHWWVEPHEQREERDGEREGGSKEKQRRGGGEGRSVTLEEIRRLSSPLMTVEIVFQRGEMPELSSLFCVALRASCVRFRLPVSLPGSGPLSPSHKRLNGVRPSPTTERQKPRDSPTNQTVGGNQALWGITVFTQRHKAFRLVFKALWIFLTFQETWTLVNMVVRNQNKSTNNDKILNKHFKFWYKFVISKIPTKVLNKLWQQIFFKLIFFKFHVWIAVPLLSICLVSKVYRDTLL